MMTETGLNFRPLFERPHSRNQLEDGYQGGGAIFDRLKKWNEVYDGPTNYTQLEIEGDQVRKVGIVTRATKALQIFGTAAKNVITHPIETTKSVVKRAGWGTAAGFAVRAAGYTLGAPLVPVALAGSAVATGVNTYRRASEESKHSLKYYRDNNSHIDRRDGDTNILKKVGQVAWDVSYGKRINQLAREAAYGVKDRWARIADSVSLVERAQTSEELVKTFERAGLNSTQTLEMLDKMQADLVWARGLHGNTMTPEQIEEQRKFYKVIKQARMSVGGSASVRRLRKEQQVDIQKKAIKAEVITEVAKTPARFMVGFGAGRLAAEPVQDVMHKLKDLSGEVNLGPTTAHAAEANIGGSTGNRNIMQGVTSINDNTVRVRMPTVAELQTRIDLSSAASTLDTVRRLVTGTSQDYYTTSVQVPEVSGGYGILKLSVDKGDGVFHTLVKHKIMHVTDPGSGREFIERMREFIKHNNIPESAVDRMESIASRPGMSADRMRIEFGAKEFDKLFTIKGREIPVLNVDVKTIMDQPGLTKLSVDKGDGVFHTLVKHKIMHVTDPDSAKEFLTRMKVFIEQNEISNEDLQRMQEIAAKPGMSADRMRVEFGAKEFDKLFLIRGREIVVLDPEQAGTVKIQPAEVKITVPSLIDTQPPLSQPAAEPVTVDAHQAIPMRKPGETVEEWVSDEAPVLGNINFADKSPIEIKSNTKLPFNTNFGSVEHNAKWTDQIMEPSFTSISTVKSSITGAIIGFGHSAYKDGHALPFEELRKYIEGSKGTNFLGMAQVEQNLQDLSQEGHTISITQNGKSETFRLVSAAYAPVNSEGNIDDANLYYNNGNKDSIIFSFCGTSAIKAIGFLGKQFEGTADIEAQSALAILNNPKADGEEVTDAIGILSEKLEKINPRAATQFYWMYIQREKNFTTGKFLPKEALNSPNVKNIQKLYNFKALSDGRYVLRFERVKT